MLGTGLVIMAIIVYNVYNVSASYFWVEDIDFFLGLTNNCEVYIAGFESYHFDVLLNWEVLR